MPAPASAILQFLIPLLWICIDSAPKHQKNWIFDKFLTSREVVEELLHAASLVFAPGLLEVLQSATPPDVAYFKSLPTKHTKYWAIYLLVLERTHCRPRIYIGSGTSTAHGVFTRLRNYDHGTILPMGVKESKAAGYTITQKGLLCWTPIPSASLVPAIRVLVCALEATFTFAFWALRAKTEYGYGLAHICLWDRKLLPYDGLCTHTALRELPSGDYNISAEELEAQALGSKERLNENVRRCRENAKAKNIAEYNAKMASKAKSWREKNPELSKEVTKRSIAKSVKEQKYFCDVCKHAFTTKAKLKKHLSGPLHAARARQLEYFAKQGADAKGTISKAVRERKNYCSVCDYAFTTPYELRQHLSRATHAARLRQLEKASSSNEA